MTKLDIFLDRLNYDGLSSLNLEMNPIRYVGRHRSSLEETFVATFGYCVPRNHDNTIQYRIESLYVGYKELGDDDAAKIAIAVLSSTTLASLKILNKIINISSFTKILSNRSNSHLNSRQECRIVSLDLSQNGIGDDEATEIAIFLGSNSSLTSLSLKRNHIGDEGVGKIAVSLESNTSLTSLKLKLNNVGDEGANKAIAAIGSNFALTSLDLSSNGIRGEILNEINNILERNKNNKIIRKKTLQIRSFEAILEFNRCEIPEWVLPYTV